MTPHPRIALLLIGDGRTTLKHATMLSFHTNATGAPIAFIVEVDDSAHQLGFCGAIREGWAKLRELPGWDYVIHVEEDWLFDRPVPLGLMADLLDAQPQLAQVALMRGPVAPAELKAGSLVAMWPDEYARKTFFAEPHPDDPAPNMSRALDYLEHRLYFTTNPSLYRRELVEQNTWPEGPGCEAAFTRRMVADGRSFACLGHGEPWITHTGTKRTGKGY